MLFRQSSGFQAESLESISKRYEVLLDDVAKRVAAMVTGKSNLLLDYVGKFINQTLASANLPPNSIQSRAAIPLGDSHPCEEMPIDVGSCAPHINYLDNKQYQFVGLSKALVMIKDYFAKAQRKCDNVLSKQRCRKLIVSR